MNAVEPRNDSLTKIENKILGIEYPDEKLEKRLNRLEEYLYGQSKQGTPKARLSKILETTKYSMLDDDNSIAADDFSDDDFIEDNSVDYPILDDVEKKLGLSTTKNSLNSRLATIEKKMFNTTHDKEDYFSRVERIKSKIYKGNSLAMQNPDDFNNPISDFENYNSTSSLNNNFFNRGISSVRYKLSLLEQRLLKNTFNEETNNDRLARLENVVFDTQFYNEDESERLSRLESALKAKKSSPKYDNNKFQQGLSTAMQIGAMVLMVLAFIL